jgi:hypothetical protein
MVNNHAYCPTRTRIQHFETCPRECYLGRSWNLEAIVYLAMSNMTPANIMSLSHWDIESCNGPMVPIPKQEYTLVVGGGNCPCGGGIVGYYILASLFLIWSKEKEGVLVSLVIALSNYFLDL